MDRSGGSVPPRTLDILPDEPTPRRTRAKRDAPTPAGGQAPTPQATNPPIEQPPAATRQAPPPVIVTPTEPYPQSAQHLPAPPAPVAPAAQIVPVSTNAPDGQYAAGLRALQEAFAIDIAEREDRHRSEMQALQQSFANDVAARDNHARSELQGLHQRFTADIAEREDRHRAEIAALQQALEELRTQLAEAGANRGREAEARASVEAELEWHRGELQGTRNEVIRVKAQAADLTTSLTGAQQHGERWVQEARRLEAELKNARAEAEQAAANAAFQLDNTNHQLEDTAAELAATREHVARLSEQSAALEVAGGQLRQTIGEQRAVRERLTEERDAARQHAAAVEGQLRTAEFDAEQAAEDAARKLTDSERRSESADEHVARLAGQTAVHEATIEELRQVLAEQQGSLKMVTLEHDGAMHRIAELESELEVLNRKPAAAPLDEPGAPVRKPTASAEEIPASAAAEGGGEDDRPVSLAEGLTLDTWQRNALAAWNNGGHRGVVEAITAEGNQRLAHWAIGEALDQDMKVLVLAPTAERAERWYSSLRAALPINRVGKHVGSRDERPGAYDVMVSTVANATKERPFGATFKGLIVADDVHTCGTPELSVALDQRYTWRLGITTMYERTDDGIATYLDPYFGGVSYRLGYARALTDHVVAPFDIALVAVQLSASEQSEYDALGQQTQRLAAELTSAYGVHAEPAEAFASSVAALASGRVGPARTAARAYQKTVAKQSELVTINSAKDSVLKALAAKIHDAGPALVYLDSEQTAGHVTKLLGRENCTTKSMPVGPDEVCLLAGARGSDGSGDITLGIVVGASTGKRQMANRLSRIISDGSEGRRGRLVVLQVASTDEDQLANDDAPFLAAVRPHAANLQRFSSADTGALLEFLAPAPTA